MINHFSFIPVVPKETIKKFTTSKIKIHIDKTELKKNILKTTVTMERPDTHKTVVIPNLKISQLINEVPISNKPEMKTPVYPGDNRVVTLKIVAEVPHVGSKTKEIVMPVKNGSKCHNLVQFSFGDFLYLSHKNLAFAEIIYYTPDEMKKVKKYTQLITVAHIKTTVEQQQFPKKKLVAKTQVVNRDTQQPIPEFKITWIVNNKPQGHQPQLTHELPKLPKILNVTVVASLPLPEFRRVSTQIFYPQSGERGLIFVILQKVFKMSKISRFCNHTSFVFHGQ